MKKTVLLIGIFTVMTMLVNAQNDNEMPKDNPLVLEWETPYQTPPFDKIKPEHYIPAYNYAIKAAKEEIYRITHVKMKPSFNNTIAALDRSGSLLNRINGVFFNMLYCNSTPELQEIAQKISPMLTEYSNDITLDPILFNRIKEVYANPGKLNPEQQMLLENTYRAFLNSGATLSEDDKKIFREVTMELSQLSLSFNQNVLNATNSWYKNVTSKKDLKGIPEADLAIAKEKAKEKKLKGWVFDLSYPSFLAVMKYADNRELRKEMYIHNGSKAFGGEYDNSKNIKEILMCRDKIAKLLGYHNYAEYALQDRMAENPKKVYNLLDQLLKYSIPVAKKEIESLNQFASESGFKGTIERWDFTYYSEKQKSKLFNLNDEMLKPYFKLENVIDGVFALATDLYDLKFIPTDKIPKYHPDVKVYEVYRDKQIQAILYLDFHPRASKKDGAWMTNFREQYINDNGEKIIPLVSLVMNFTPSTPKEPSLLTFYEVSTFLHEFGHALHGMASNVTYQSLSGTNVKRDFVELPSQINENWASEFEFLKKFAFHYKTGEVIPMELISKLREFDNFQAGYTSCRQLSFGYLDMMWHTINPDEIENVLKIERKELDKTELMPVVPNTCMSTSFSHIFSGGYSAGYYSYNWAEVLDADAFGLFREKGVMNKEVARSFYDNILSKGGSEKPMDLYKKFRGREPEINALLERSGLK